ncbi:hypothetical protein [aff. Roholtiella sp. LEGE 12411]|uniref:hypothetical protein n=1 Tax=aff. Roholtiella sp. LEGE 12411 TaxID=1828822 RepID=UPI0018806CF3|nr:hypothetical protein [aff. Roholtiella sp. LEGE 12411]MBE9038605.1 hypothetical protein [aff. Roholtiella sp. LEGE 12411]
MRASIRPHLQPYFKALQGQMECDSLTEALNHLLMDLKRRGYSFLEDYQYKPAISNNKPQSVYTPRLPHLSLTFLVLSMYSTFPNESIAN